MGTRADFYAKEGDELVWQGSIAWDGYPSGIKKSVLEARSAKDFLSNLDAFLKTRDCTRRPENGWPWPWDDSCTTDYAYIFDGEKVVAYSFGYGPFDPNAEEPEWNEESGKTAIFPNMKHRANVTNGGFIVIGVPE